MVCATQELGVAASDIKKLKEGGINTVESLAHSTKKELCAIKGISEAKVAKMQTEGARAPLSCQLLAVPVHCLAKDSVCAAWKVVPMGFTTASVIAEQRGDIVQITTGCKEFDTVLEGAALQAAVEPCIRFAGALPALCSLAG